MKIWFLFLFPLLLLKCNSDISKDFDMLVSKKDRKFIKSDTLEIKISNRKNHTIDSICYFLDKKRIPERFPLINFKLGIHLLTSSVYYKGNKTEYKTQITLLSDIKPKLYTYAIINEYPHDKQAYTQGLEFYRDTLYESTGLRGNSSIRKVNFRTGEVLEKKSLDKVYFAEGISFLNDKLFQLTWQGNIGFQYDPDNLKVERSFDYQKSKEGWGLCNDGKRLYKSDGSNLIWILDSKTQKEVAKIQVMTDKTALNKINELEWVNGKIFANTYQYNKEVGIIIDPTQGAVEGVIDFSGLKKRVEQVSNLDVLNGIAYHPKRKTFFITGKNWSKLFEVKISPKK
jgi:glutamine cyclotransferase